MQVEQVAKILDLTSLVGIPLLLTKQLIKVVSF